MAIPCGSETSKSENFKLAMKRREFLSSSLTASAALLSTSYGWAAPKRKIGLQLYSLRDVVFTDTKAVLQKVASFGYTALETFGYNDGKLFGMSNADFAAYVKSLGMHVVSGHYGLNQISGDTWQRAVDDAKAIGQQFMVMPYLVEKDRQTIDDYKRVCEMLNKAGEVCNAAGIRFGYHNHAFEFDPVDGQIPYDVMLKELDPKLVMMEMDIYWVVFAGRDPLRYFEGYPGRFELWHVKDMSQADRSKNADVGTGTIDFKPIFAKAKKAGLKQFFVEQETYPESSLKSIEASARNVAKLV